MPQFFQRINFWWREKKEDYKIISFMLNYGDRANWIVSNKPQCCSIDLEQNTVRIMGKNVCFQLLEKDKEEYRDVREELVKVQKQHLQQKTIVSWFILAVIEDSDKQIETYLIHQFSRYGEKSSDDKPPTCERHSTLSNKIDMQDDGNEDSTTAPQSFLPHKLVLAAIFLGIVYTLYRLCQ